MRIGILSFHAPHNYGSMLQNYALQQFLISEGHTVETINLRNKGQRFLYSHPLQIGKTTPYIKTIIGRVRDVKWLFIECKRWHLFERFLKEKLILTKEYKDWNTIKKDLPSLNYDAIIVGSDQIWNTFCVDFDWAYFLPGDIGHVKKIAFSPSFGNEIPRMRSDGALISKIIGYLNDFDSISVREENASEYLHQLLNKDVPFTADPTLIVDPSVFQDMIKDPLIKEPYIYYYTPSHIPDIKAEQLAIELADALNLKIVTSYPHFMMKTKMVPIVSGPMEFLNLIYNAQFVVGKSYHLILFSLLFHKNYFTIKCKDDARINTLQNQLKITGRNIESLEDYYHISEIDFRDVDDELVKIKQKAVDYLRTALNFTIPAH